MLTPTELAEHVEYLEKLRDKMVMFQTMTENMAYCTDIEHITNQINDFKKKLGL